MANDRYENPRDDQFGASDRYDRERQQAGRSSSGRGFFERAGDEISSWFGDDDAERRRERDDRSGGPQRGEPPRGNYGASPSTRQPEWDRNERGQFDRSQERPRDDYRPFAGDYGRGGSNPGERYREERQRGGGFGSAVGAAAGAMFGDRSGRPTPRTRDHDPHYSEWRQRQIDALDHDYDEYRREHQSKFDNDFSSWRGTRQTKRQTLAQVREHMEVVGSDEQSVGVVDKVRGDKVILTKDSQGGVHKSLGCAAIDRIEGDRLFLTQPADDAKRGLIEERSFDERTAGDPRDYGFGHREDRQQSQMSEGPHNLERSFSGTYPDDKR